MPGGDAAGSIRPDLIEGITLDRPIGAGATSTVYLAHDNANPKERYAVKFLTAYIASQPTARKRWEREAQLLINLRHENIVRGISHGIVDLHPFLVMEFLQGESLSDRLRRYGRLEIGEVWAVAEAALHALGAAFRANIIHRDVKPANMLRLNDGTIKLMDFGLAKYLDDVGLTQTGSVLGTPMYLAPEMASGEEEITIRADLYSLGSTLFHLAAGRPPFTDLNTSLLLTRKITDDVPDIRTVDPELPGDLAFFIARLCERRPNLRPDTPSEALELLRQVRSGALTTSSTPAAAESSRAKLETLFDDDALIDNEVLRSLITDKQVPTKPVVVDLGKVLFYEDDRSLECYVLVTGVVEILKSGRRIATIGEEGAFIGEMAPLTHTPRSATVRALERTVLLQIAFDDFNRFLERNSAMALALARDLAHRLHHASDQYQRISNLHALVTRHLSEINAVLGVDSDATAATRTSHPRR